MCSAPARRMTKQRRVILDELRESKSHPTADELYARVRRKIPRISLGTVYRNLQTLAEDGQVRTIRDGSRTRYDGSMHEHYHVRCLSCGKVGDMPAESAGCVECNLNSDSNFSILGYKVEFVGLCPDCKHQGKEDVIGENKLTDYRRVS